jgi:hypothetical protein
MTLKLWNADTGNENDEIWCRKMSTQTYMKPYIPYMVKQPVPDPELPFYSIGHISCNVAIIFLYRGICSS